MWSSLTALLEDWWEECNADRVILPLKLFVTLILLKLSYYVRNSQYSIIPENKNKMIKYEIYSELLIQIPDLIWKSACDQPLLFSLLFLNRTLYPIGSIPTISYASLASLMPTSNKSEFAPFNSTTEGGLGLIPFCRL